MHRARRWLIVVVVVAASAAACGGDDGPSGPGGTIQIYNCPAGFSYSVGERVQGTVVATDCDILEEGLRGDVYRFELDEASAFTASLTAPAEGVNLLLIDSDTQVVAGTFASQGDTTDFLFDVIPAGTYVIAVFINGLAAPNPIAYSFVTTRQGRGPFFGCTPGTSLTPGSPVTGSLEATDCPISGGRTMDRHNVTVTNAGTYRISLSSADIDTYLYLFDPSGVPIAENDDRAPPTDLNSELTLTLEPGTYAIGASSYDVETGSYTVRVDLVPPPAPDAR